MTLTFRLKDRGQRSGVPYLWGHSANGGYVIPGADEVWSVDLQLKVTQPLDNSLRALGERRQVEFCHYGWPWANG